LARTPHQTIFPSHCLIRGSDTHVHMSTTTHLVLRHSSGIFMYYYTTRNKFIRYKCLNQNARSLLDISNNADSSRGEFLAQQSL